MSVIWFTGATEGLQEAPLFITGIVAMTMSNLYCHRVFNNGIKQLSN